MFSSDDFINAIKILHEYLTTKLVEHQLISKLDMTLEPLIDRSYLITIKFNSPINEVKEISIGVKSVFAVSYDNNPCECIEPLGFYFILYDPSHKNLSWKYEYLDYDQKVFTKPDDIIKEIYYISKRTSFL